jgi:hypothetical protein
MTPKSSGGCWLCAVAVVAGLAACTAGGPLRPPSNVLIVTLDTTQADRLPACGYQSASMPALDRLAREGAVFDRATTVAPLTLPAHTSLSTGLYPTRHGVRENADPPDVARFYAAAPPTQVWNQAAQQVSAAQGRSLSQNARAFALLNMAIRDALVSVFDMKYFYVRWRPVTAIRAGDTDGNQGTDADVSWTPLITTPSFPSYASAHGSASGAAREVLERVFDAGRHDITLTTPGLPAVTLHYRHFREITDDIDDARVYGGIHFRFDQEAGGRLGRSVGAYVYEHHLQAVDRD